METGDAKKRLDKEACVIYLYTEWHGKFEYERSAQLRCTLRQLLIVQYSGSATGINSAVQRLFVLSNAAAAVAVGGTGPSDLYMSVVSPAAGRLANVVYTVHIYTKPTPT